MPKRDGKIGLDREVDRESLFLQMLASERVEVSDQAMAYFREHPEEIDEVTANTRVHRFFLWVGMVLGILAVAASRLLSWLPFENLVGQGVESFISEIVFEGGVALMGAALTAYFMGVLLNAQQKRAAAFRREIRRRLRED
ncbi:hypothetical protein [Tropicimonas marinistellae]|uniref:hypothetical protein n=1 Tax=Tropicimonas marinistellae TaxID=1739787 RepID=UPI000831E111|nr:hypothetical protein [Tropicimonas marinistellae]